MNGVPVKDNRALADSFNDPQVDRGNIFVATLTDRKICEEGFIHARD